MLVAGQITGAVPGAEPRRASRRIPTGRPSPRRVSHSCGNPAQGRPAQHAPSDGRQSARRVPDGLDQGWSVGSVEGHTVRPHHGPDDVDGEIGAQGSGREEIDQSAAWELDPMEG